MEDFGGLKSYGGYGTNGGRGYVVPIWRIETWTGHTVNSQERPVSCIAKIQELYPISKCIIVNKLLYFLSSIIV